MTDDDGHPALDGYPLDDDYIDVADSQRADVSVASDHDDDLDRQPPPESDKSWRYGTMDANTLAGTSMDEVMDRVAVQANDGRSDTRTMFYAFDAPTDTRDMWWRLSKINDGMWASDRDTKNKAADNNRWIDSFCTQLDMTEHQRERTRHIIDTTALNELGPYSAQESVLAAVSLSCNEDDRWVRDEQMYTTLVEGCGTTPYRIRRVRDLLREKSSALDTSGNCQ